MAGRGSEQERGRGDIASTQWPRTPMAVPTLLAVIRDAWVLRCASGYVLAALTTLFFAAPARWGPRHWHCAAPILCKYGFVMCRVWGACERVPTPQDRAVLFCRVRFTQRIAHESLVETHRYRRDTARVRPKTTRVPKTKWIKRTWPRRSGVYISAHAPLAKSQTEVRTLLGRE